jgi:exonuclease SbcC
MRIIALETNNFGPLPNGRIEFNDGMTVVKGPNEAGKSFMRRALTLGLYGDGSSSSAEIREVFKKWNSDDDYSISIELEHKGDSYTLIRDFGNKKNILIMPGGKEEKDKKTIETFVAGAVGLPAALSFEATACIPQEEVEKVTGARATLREIIEGRLAGSGSDTDRLVKKIESKATRILTKNKAKGLLPEQQALEGELAEGLAEASERVATLAANKNDLSVVFDELETGSSTLKDKEKALDGSKLYIDAQVKYEQANKDYDLAEDYLQKCRKAKEDLAESSAHLEKLKASQAETSAELLKAQEFVEKDKAVSGMEEELAAVRKKIEAMADCDRQLSEKQAELDSIKVVDATDLKNVRTIPGEIAGLQMTLGEQLFSVEVDAAGGTEFVLTADGEPASGARAEAHAEATVDFPGLAAVRFRNETGEGTPLVEEIDRKKSVLADVLAGYGVTDPEGLEALGIKRLEAEREFRDLKSQKAIISGGADLSELQASDKELKQKLDEESAAREVLLGFAVPAEELEKRKSEVAGLAGEIKVHEGKCASSKGVLGAVGEDESALDKSKKEAAKDLAKAEASRDEYAIYKCSPEDYERQKREKDHLAARVEKLKDQKNRLEIEIEHETLGEEDVARFEEKLEMTRNRIERLEEELRVLELIAQNINGARQDSIERFSSDIEAKMGEILATVTDGRYNKVEVGGDLRVRVFSAEKDEWIDPEDKKDSLLSSGALDQLYLAARLALLDLITGDCRPPVILDDTFVTFDDMGRKARAFELLESVATDHQVLYFTCHECPGDMQVLEVKQ